MSEDKYKKHFPEWIQQIFDSKMDCGECGALLTTAGIGSIGLYCSDFLLDDDTRPLCGIEVDCTNCGQSIRITSGDDLAELFKAIECFYEVITTTRMGGDPSDPNLPSPNFKPESQIKPTNESPPKFGGRFGHVVNGGFGEEAKKRRWQKRRTNHKPISEEEIAKFKRRLARMSWKRSTKAYKRFLRDLGIDTNEGGEE